ncbi:MAG: PilZ domain-containing protein [Planctomycetia bacterium]|nr:PilZ domain-containing protein [Planctomycetia bacterium]
MTGPRERIEQAERRLARVADLQETIEGVQQELTAYREVLTRKLALLQRAPEPARQPTPPPGRRDSRPAMPQPVRSAPTMHGQSNRTPPNIAPPPPQPFEDSPVPQRRDSKVTPLPGPAVAGPPRRDSKPLPPPPVSFESDDDLAMQERRSSPRRKGNPVPIVITNANASIDSFQGWVLDRSAGGLRILVDQAAAIGTVLAVRPAKAHGSFPWIQVRVRNCQPERSSWSLGVQFVSKPAWGELQAFG